ncbi:MAG TPA: hypothetical protein VK930_04485 [Verrucomicrobiae bacterium]|jgi:hypothetical protein|nr:hypothetical protein [Verrucomicrobiae bacterium]
MHVHANQVNPNAQTDALYAAEQAAAKRAAEGTRRKLLEFASELAGEAESEEGCVVKLGAREQSDEQKPDQGNQGSRKKGKAQVDSADADNAISDWA